MHQIHQPASTIRAALLIGLAIALLSVVGITASAQSGKSPAQLRRENDQLRERITELEAALEESQRRIDRLEEQIAESAKSDGPDERRTAPPEPTPTPSQPNARRVPSDPAACPDALYESLVDAYNETFPGIDRPAFSEVQHWVRRVGRDRHRTEWVVRVHSTTVFQGRKSSLIVNIIDPESGEDLCKNFAIYVNYKDAMRIRDATDVPHWKFEGTLTAQPTADRTRPEFNDNVFPKLVGPFAVFGFDFDVETITPVMDEHPAPER